MNHKPCVFISWSGEKGRKVAESLSSWLPYIFDGPKFWFSHKDIPVGARWLQELTKCLETSQLGILIVTPESLHAPWMIFEAGALSANRLKQRDLDVNVMPYLVALEERDLSGPLAQFHAVQANQAGTLRLLKSINDILGGRQDQAVIEKRFEKFWTDLNATIETVRNECEEERRARQAQPDYKTLHKNLADVSDLLRQVVSSGFPISDRNHYSEVELKIIEGAWINKDCGTHIYITFSDGKLFAPYCYRGNSELTAVCYDWRRIGDYFFSRFRWTLRQDVSGFAFFRLVSNDVLEGAWWYSSGGVKIRWERSSEKPVPVWASKCIEAIQKGQLSWLW